MKKRIAFISICILFIICGQTVIGQYVKQNERNQKSVIALSEFEIEQKEMSDYYSDLISTQIPFMVSIALRDYGYQIKWTKQIVEQSSSEIQLKYRQKEEKTITDLLSSTGADYNISGSFVLWDENSLDIEIVLNKFMEDGQFEEVNRYELNIFTLSELHYELSRIAKNIHTDVLESQLVSEAKTIATVRYSIVSPASQELDMALVEDIPYSVYYNLKDIPNIKLIDWEKSMEDFPDPGKDGLDKRSSKLKADVFIDGQIYYYDEVGNYTILPRLYIKNSKCVIVIPGPYANRIDSDVQSRVSSYIISLLNEIIDVKGEYNNELIDVFLSDDKSILLNSAQYYFENNQYEVAATLTNSVLQKNKDSHEAKLLLAKCKTELFEFYEATILCENISKNNPDVINVYFQKGLIFQYQEIYNRAAREFKKVKKTDENYPNINYQIGLVHYYDKNYEQAIESFNEQKQLNQNEPKVLSMLALSYLEFGIDQTDYNDQSIAFNNAYSAAATASDLLSQNIESEVSESDISRLQYLILSEHASSAFYEEKYEEAVKLLLLMKEFKIDTYGFDMLRFCYSRLDEYNDLDELIDEGIENQIYSDTIFFQQAQYLRGIKDSEGNYLSIKLSNAIKYLDKYLAANKNQSVALRIKGSTYFRMGSLDKAVDLYEQAYEYEKNEQVKTDVVLNIAEVSIMNGNYENSLVYLDKLEMNEWIPEERSYNSNRCLYLYLNITTRYLLNQDANEDRTILGNYLEENNITGWSYTTFMKWVTSSDNGLGEEQKKYLSNLTELMESRTFAY